MSRRAVAAGDPLAKTSTPTRSITRSSAAEYLTFVAAAGQGGVEAIYADENVWLTQKMMGQLYDVNVRTVNGHLIKIFSDRELPEDSVIRKFRITATDGNPNRSGNMRDHATLEQLVVLSNLESINAVLIHQGVAAPARLAQLNSIAITQMRSLLSNNTVKQLAPQQGATGKRLT